VGQIPDDDALRPEELRPEGGTWNGLLFDNPKIGLPPALTWTFEFRFARVSREDEDSAVELTVDWVPLPGASWSAMAGHTAAGASFQEPIECSAYFFEHHRYNAVRLRILEQAGSRLLVAVEVHGDLDGLGVPSWRLEEWLDFEGIHVQLDGVSTLETAAQRLAGFTDASGLVAVDRGHNVRFVKLPE
jgi:hypothetical protein